MMPDRDTQNQHNDALVNFMTMVMTEIPMARWRTLVWQTLDGGQVHWHAAGDVGPSAIEVSWTPGLDESWWLQVALEGFSIDPFTGASLEAAVTQLRAGVTPLAALVELDAPSCSGRVRKGA